MYPLHTVARILRIDDSYSISMGLNGLCLIYVVEHQWHQTWAPPPLRTVRTLHVVQFQTRKSGTYITYCSKE